MVGGERLSKIMKKIKEIRLPGVPLKPSISIIIFILVSVSIFIFGGGVYDIMESPMSILPYPNQPIFYYQGMTDQTLTESLYFIFFLIIGFFGGFLSFRSTRYAYRPREARIFLLIGVAMLISAFIGCEALLMKKGV